ncbi:LytR C-terminal domain-containing protein [Actinokineospora sp. PR83]|uniref:LytR C-terminal domain-containing protein n=1 Tax=Actinokineospora sp. PR83 TaxID=2884908 RepID=UPI001F189D6C|nr:LytR C-terminal domain-containing protein [Actinokineospora sp. PR83]MCG8915350.1 LytR C-terminal domain-containing protein [Actinokineospora sp. PR83]
MTTDPSGPARPGRLIGLALMGVAAVTAVIGVVTIVNGTGDTSAAPPASSSVTAPAPPSGDLTSSPATTGSMSTSMPSAPSEPSAPATTTVPPAATTTTTAVPPAPPAASGAPVPGAGPSTRSEPVRVYNNSFIKGLAEEAGRDLAARGWTVAETGNYSGGKIPVTTVYFQPGSGQEAAAQELAADFGIRSEARFDGIKDASPGLILIVTQDYQNPKDK